MLIMIKLGINMEFVRHHDMSFADGVRKASEIGYEYIEPMVHLGRELLSEAGYFHSVSMYNDPLFIKEVCQQYSKTPDGLDSIYNLVKSSAIGINPDTGNSYLAGGSDVYEWLERVKDRLVHLHAKDISLAQSNAERGKVSGTPVGCACGDGVVDWNRIINIVNSVKKDIVFSVECGTIDQAIRSFEHLSKLI
jgi:sugar phosphate isomerase/epimerase